MIFFLSSFTRFPCGFFNCYQKNNKSTSVYLFNLVYFFEHHFPLTARLHFFYVFNATFLQYFFIVFMLFDFHLRFLFTFQTYDRPTCYYHHHRTMNPIPICHFHSFIYDLNLVDSHLFSFPSAIFVFVLFGFMFGAEHCSKYNTVINVIDINQVLYFEFVFYFILRIIFFFHFDILIFFSTHEFLLRVV